MRIKLWGTRGSIPSPLLTEEIEAKIFSALSAASEAAVDLSNPTAIRAFIASLPRAIRGTAGGDTACLEVRSDNNLLIFDCGSGMRHLGMELLKEEFGRGQGVAHIFICHTHWDHVQGWPFFKPSFIRGNKFFVYGVHPDLEARFRLQQTAPSMFPVDLDYHAADIEFVRLQEGSVVELGQTQVTNIRFHHAGDSYGYRVTDQDGTFIYAGDSEYKTLDAATTQHYVEFFRGADALVFDAMFSWPNAYLFEDWGHSSAVAGVDLATRAGVSRLLLFHHDPYATDEQIWNLRKDAEEYLSHHPERPPCEVIVAFDGLELEIWREAKLETRVEQLTQGSVVHLSGRLVEETASAALAAIEESASHNGVQPIVVDLSEVNHLNQEGLTALFSARRLWRPLALAGLSPELRHTLAKRGALEYFAIFETAANALARLEGGLKVHPKQLLGKRYKIDQLLDRCPLGDLYLATDQQAQRPVAVLIICPSLGRAPTEALMRKAKAAVDLRHPLIAEVYEAREDGDVRFLAMEHTPGHSVRQLLHQQRAVENDKEEAREVASFSSLGGLPIAIKSSDTSPAIPPAEAIRISSRIAQALEYAHRRDYYHGRLKPEDVVLLADGSIKLTNFGIGGSETDKPFSELPAYMGRLEYLAPEQLQGRGANTSSDLYALGAMLYEMLTGQPPFPATDRLEDLIGLQLRQSPVPPRRRSPGLSRSLEYLVLKLLHSTPQERPADASAVCQAFASLTPELYQRPLLGRDIPLQKLHQHIERVAQGQGRMLVLKGERGVGKSRLASSIAKDSVAGYPVTTLYGESFAYEDSRPFKPFANTLRQTLLNLPARQLSRLLADLGDLARPLTVLIPQLQPALSAFVPSDTNCERLQEAACATLRLLTAESVVMLVLDGLQWMDPNSLHLLELLARQEIPRLLIVTLYRPEEVDPEHRLSQVLNALEPLSAEQLDVTPLGPIEVHQMAASLGSQIPPDFALWLYGETQGNPLHTEQLIQAYLEGPSETRQPRERARATLLDDVILRRLERLSKGTLATLRQAAVLGHTFSFNRLRATLEQTEQEILANLDTALQAGLVLGHPAEDRYSFAHPLIREVLYSEMLTGVRRRYHARVAHVLEQERISGRLDEKLDLLAHHFLQAGEHEKAMTYLARAIRRARRLCAHDTALEYAEIALDVVERLIQTATDASEREQRQKQRDDLLTARTQLQAAVAQRAPSGHSATVPREKPHS